VTKRLHVGASGELSTGSHETKDEASCPMDRDRAKSDAQKGKGKASSSTQSGNELLGMKDMFKSLCNVSKTFVKAEFLKQWNKMKPRSTDNMPDEKKKIHR
jgi:hypothetical protein